MISSKSAKKRLWKERLKFFFRISFRSIYFNFKYLPFHQARHLPILISKKVYFKRLYGNVLLNEHLGFGNVRIGFGDVGIIDYKYSRTIWDVSGKVVFKGKADIGYGSKIAVGQDGELIFGNNFIITAQSSIVADKSIVFGDYCMLSWDILIMDTDLHPIKNRQSEIINSPKPIHIGNHVWIGCRSLILKGVNIANNCIIGANSHIYKSLEKEHSVYAGNPVKQLIEGATWEN